MYDTHTHLGMSPFEEEYGYGPGEGDPEELLEFMDEHGIQDTLVYPMSFTAYFDPQTADQVVMEPSGEMETPYEKENRDVLNWTSQYEGLHPVMTFSLGEHENIDDVENLVQENEEVKALKIHPRSSHTDLTELQDSGILDVAREYDLPIISHLEGDNVPTFVEEFDLRSYSMPHKLASVARENQDVVFQGAHLGRASGEFLDTVSELDNLYTDCSPPYTLLNAKDELSSDAVEASQKEPLEALEELVQSYPDSMVYGTDYPFMRTRDVTLEREGELIDELSDEAKEIMAENAEELYNFESS